jgi:DNA polymerase-3 subunit epsilon
MRDSKGHSLLAFPSDYTVVDIETTGLSPEYDEIIEICAFKYRGSELVNKYSTLVKPEREVDNFIMQLTGITNNMLASAPSAVDVMQPLYNFIGSDVIVGHNINFDINFLYDYCVRILSKPLSNDFVDTMRIARLLHKENKHNRLSDLAAQYNLSYEGAHRAGFDCTLTNSIYEIFKKECIDCSIELNTLAKHSQVKAADISATLSEIPADSPLLNKVVVFTGALEKMLRKDAMQLVANMGGINSDNVTKKTNYLVLGNNDYCTTIKNGKSSKQRKAEEYKLKGYDIEVIPEGVFYDIVNVSYVPTYQDATNQLYKDFSLSDKEVEVIEIVKSFISSSELYSDFGIARRSDNYISLLCGENDFMRFKASPRAFWVSLRLPFALAGENRDNPLFAAQANKNQFHWKCSITSVDELEKIKDFIVASYFK